jgi:AmiR/NasT family two-component response regulator
MVSSGAAARRDVVAQATGVLVAQFGIDPETACDKLAGVARDEDRAIHEVAAVVVEQNGL